MPNNTENQIAIGIDGNRWIITNRQKTHNKVKIPFIISGGISSIEDIKKIKSLNNSNIEGVIVGKSIYDGDIKINELAKQI